tara:strand:+ start:38 stop:313 length:276 start_codon:yes stop_codon:yes gene_type:complete
MIHYLLNTEFLLTLDGINKNDVNYIKNSFILDYLKKRNQYLYKNYVNIQDKYKWFESAKQHKEWSENNNKIKKITKYLQNFQLIKKKLSIK